MTDALRLGVFGGTFDPPHYGHLLLAQYAAEALNLDRVLFVLAGDPPHKDSTRQPAAHRLAMLERALTDNPQFVLSRVDLDRPGPHYSVDTLALLAEAHPGARLFFVMGADSLRDLPKWHRPQELIRRCELAVMHRPGIAINPHMHEDKLPGLAERVILIDEPPIGLSSTDITARIAAGKSARYMLPDAVLHYIDQHQLYRTTL